MIDPELLAQFEACWIRGRSWRLETGRLLYLIKPGCAYGEWTPFCKKYDLPVRTADDWIQKYKEEAGIASESQWDDANPPLAPDPEADERKLEIEEEKEKRKGRKPERHRTQLTVQLKQLNPHLLELYDEVKKRSPKTVMELWYETFFRIIEDGKEPEVLTVADFENKPAKEADLITVKDFDNQ
jgi:hypothetical protein